MHTHTYAHVHTHTHACTHIYSHDTAPCRRRLRLSLQTSDVLILLPLSHPLLLCDWRLRLKVRSVAVLLPHPSDAAICTAMLRRGIKRWMKSKLWPYPHQYHTDTSWDGCLLSTYGHVSPSQAMRLSRTHTHTHARANTHLQSVRNNRTLSPLFVCWKFSSL